MRNSMARHVHGERDQPKGAKVTAKEIPMWPQPSAIHHTQPTIND
jgi:hypothetical protein